MAAVEYQESEQDVLFILKVDMGNHHHEFINFCKNDTPEQAAFEFCQDHTLNVKVYDFICEALKQKLYQLTNNIEGAESRSRGNHVEPESLRKTEAKARQTDGESTHVDSKSRDFR